MDEFGGSTQRFTVQNYEENEAHSSSDDQFGTQPFTVPGTSAFDVDYEEEEDGTDQIQETQAFAVDPTIASTQAFAVGTFDDVPTDDPMLTVGTQPFAVAEFATVERNEANISSSANDSDYGIENQSFVAGLDVITETGVGEFDGSYDQEIAGEEVVEGDGEEIASNAGDLAMDEIASPDPEPDENEDQEEQSHEEGASASNTRRGNRISSDDDQQHQESDGEDAGLNKQRQTARRFVEDDDEGEHASEDRAGSDDDADSEKKSEVGELIANIFGDSDDDEGESDKEEDKDEQSSRPGATAVASDSETKDSDDLHAKLVVAPDFVSDFDLMMERRRVENRRRYRKRKDYDIVNDSDDVINELIGQMKQAAKKDSELNKEQKPALSKRKLLPTVVKQLKKSDLQSAFIELGVVSVIADWLSPLQDGSLPALEVRTELLKVLEQFPTLDHQILKTSGIGKAVMILYKHPKETKDNKERAGKLINEWARPIFSLQSDYRALSKEERIQRDYEHMPLAKKRRMSSMEAENKPKPEGEEDERQLRPGDKGWIGRARVPQPSTKDYVVRPKWNIESEFRKASNKKGSSMMERKIREIKERTKPKKASRAVGVSIEGRKM